MTRWANPVVPLLTLIFWPVLVFAAEGAASGGAAMESVPPWAAGTGVVIGMLGGPCFAIWYAWYMTTSRIPAIEKSHTEQLTEMRKQHFEHLSEARKQHFEQVQTLIMNYRQDVKTMWDVKREDDKNQASFRREDDNKMALALQRLAENIEEGGCRYLGPGGTGHA